jgi:sialidase-1
MNGKDQLIGTSMLSGGGLNRYLSIMKFKVQLVLDLFYLPFLVFGFCLQAHALEGVLSEWNGYSKTDFKVDGRVCFVIEPENAAVGRPWVWRARFPGYHSEIDQLLLAKGYHIAHIDTGGMLGSPAALKHWEAFYSFLTKTEGLNEKVALYGVSRGGLFVYRWAKNHPRSVACIYNDTPVCDLKSWPGGKGVGMGDAKTWAAAMAQYGFENEAAAIAYGDNPIDNLDSIAKAQIPIMHIVCENDQVVPPSENSYTLKRNLEALGHSVFHVISLEEGPRANGHHFDLTHPEIGANFIAMHTDFGERHPIYLRSGLNNCRFVFESTKKGRVAFLGGSITQMKGWRNHVAESLKNRFPDTEFDIIFAGIGSTDSSMGAFRLERDIFARGQVDLLFIESAVNELHNGREKQEIQRATEGIILNARRHNPNIDLIAQYFYDPSYVEQVRRGETPWQIAALDRIALQHNVNAIDQTIRCTTLFDSGKVTSQEFGGVHPNPAGHLVYSEMIDSLFTKAWAGPLAEQLQAHRTAWRIDSNSYSQGRFQGIESAEIIKGWKIVNNWQAKDGSVRALDRGVSYMEALKPGAELTVKFTGTAIGLPMIAGPDVGVIEFSVDGDQPKKLDQFTKWSKGLHIPWIYMLETDLVPGEHTLTLRTTDRRNSESTGYACRFRYFAVNELPLLIVD